MGYSCWYRWSNCSHESSCWRRIGIDGEITSTIYWFSRTTKITVVGSLCSVMTSSVGADLWSSHLVHDHLDFFSWPFSLTMSCFFFPSMTSIISPPPGACNLETISYVHSHNLFPLVLCPRLLVLSWSSHFYTISKICQSGMLSTTYYFLSSFFFYFFFFHSWPLFFLNWLDWRIRMMQGLVPDFVSGSSTVPNRFFLFLGSSFFPPLFTTTYQATLSYTFLYLLVSLSPQTLSPSQNGTISLLLS